MRQRTVNNELSQATNKLIMTYFDGSGRMASRAWVHKLDTYLPMHPMSGVDTIRLLCCI